MQHEKKHVFKNFRGEGGGIEYTLKTIVQHEKKCMSGVCSISPAVGESVLVGGYLPYVPSHLSART